MNNIKPRGGFTLVELIVAIVIIGICSISFMALLASQASRSGEAMVRDQATHIASAYLNEVLQKPFVDPGMVTGRNGRHFISNYNGLSDNGVRDQFNTPIASLSQFTVNVTVVPTAFSTPFGTNVSSVESKLVTVTVRRNNVDVVKLSGYRMQY